MSKTHCNRLIQSAEVAQSLAPIGVKIEKESQARELARVPAPMRQAGEFLKAMPKATGARGVGTSAVVNDDRTPTLKQIGITKKQSATAQKLAAIPADEFSDRVAALRSGCAIFSRLVSGWLLKDGRV